MVMLGQENPRKPEQGFSQQKGSSKSELKQRKRVGKAGKTTSEAQGVDEQEKEKNPTWGAWDYLLYYRL
jgi:hypothetical protein